jgi:hypothetical protein
MRWQRSRNRRSSTIRGRGSFVRPAVGLSLLAMAVSACFAVPASAVPLTPTGFHNLAGEGLNNEVAVVGNTAVVGSGHNPGGGVHEGFYNPLPCPSTRVELVDITNISAPRLVGRITVPTGVSAMDVDALSVNTPTFTGDLAALALSACGAGSGTVARGIAYYDITNPRRPRFLGRYQADQELFNPTVNCGPVTTPNVGTSPLGCASSMHTVDVQQRPDGRVLSLGTEPFASASNFSSGDVRIVDATNPRNPVQVGEYDPVPTGVPNTGNSQNGCRPFRSGHHASLYQGGNRMLVGAQDSGLQEVDLTNPAAPSPTPGEETDPYPADRSVEGNGNFATAGGASENLGLLAEEDWHAPETRVRIDTPASSDQGLTAGEKFACQATFTRFDPENTAQIYRRPGTQVPSGTGKATQFVYAGRSCVGIGNTAPDPLPKVNGRTVDLRGKIAVVDRLATTRQFVPLGSTNQLAQAGGRCSLAEKALGAQERGAIGVVVLDAVFTCNPPLPDGTTGCAFGPDGIPDGLKIPMVSMDNPDGTRLRDTLCPSVAPAGSGNCTSTTPVVGALVDKPGTWGALKVIDLATNAVVGQYQTPRTTLFPPPDLGVYSAHHAEALGNRAYLAWNSDGLRVIDLTVPSTPAELFDFVPPDTPDPSNSRLPAKALVEGVDVFQRPSSPGGCAVVISDTNSGLYTFENAALCPPPIAVGASRSARIARAR